jgi:hypothetical protein
MSRSELLDHNIMRFLNKTQQMPSSIILNQRFVQGLINECKENIQFIDTIDIHRLPIKYRGIRIYEYQQLNEGQIELTLEL